MRLRILLGVAGAVLAGFAVAAQVPATLPPSGASPALDLVRLDSLVAFTRRTFKVPGLAVAVVKDGRVVLAKGYGVRSLATREPVDANTLFGIASNTKAFTTAALGLLVDEGRLRWDDKLTNHIPSSSSTTPTPRPSLRCAICSPTAAACRPTLAT